jgi:hypothetical protein
VTVLESLEGLAAQHGESGVPFKELETATRSRLDYRALTDALNAVVNDGAVGKRKILRVGSGADGVCLPSRP